MLGSSLLLFSHSSSSIIHFGLVSRHSLSFSCRFSVRLMGSTTNNNLTVLNNSTSDKKEKEKEKEKEDVLVQYIVLRRDLIDTWPLGSVVTQGCHASVSAIWSYKDNDTFTNDYCSPTNINSMHKVTLEVKGETQLKNLSEKLTASAISHKLWIEQPENIPTCLATKPYPKSMVSSFFRKLKLCK